MGVTRAWALESAELDKLAERINKFGDQIKPTINSYLYKAGAQYLINDMTELIPVSTPYPPWRPKDHTPHAKHSKWYLKKDMDLSVRLSTWGQGGKHWYLKFPEMGTGTSRGNAPLEFMERGAEEAAPKIMDELLDKVIDNF